MAEFLKPLARVRHEKLTSFFLKDIEATLYGVPNPIPRKSGRKAAPKISLSFIKELGSIITLILFMSTLFSY